MNKYQEAFEDLCVTWDEEGMGKDHFSKQYPYLYNTIKELVDRETKYKRAFEILKDRLTFVVYESPNIPSTYFLLAEREEIEEEEVELLEELMKDDE